MFSPLTVEARTPASPTPANPTPANPTPANRSTRASRPRVSRARLFQLTCGGSILWRQVSWVPVLVTSITRALPRAPGARRPACAAVVVPQPRPAHSAVAMSLALGRQSGRAPARPAGQAKSSLGGASRRSRAPLCGAAPTLARCLPKNSNAAPSGELATVERRQSPLLGSRFRGPMWDMRSSAPARALGMCT
jgi:hypothetical protein